jgi:superfamily I DNA/RNA helicase
VFDRTIKKLVDPDTTSFALNAELEGCQTVLRALFTQAIADYSLLKANANALDFDDLEQKAIVLLAGNSEIRLRWQQELAAVLVDEYQDTNRRQKSLLAALNGQRGVRFMVGDAKQSIYRFRGAEVELFLRTQDEVSRRRGLVVPLSTSYRAHPALVQIHNRLLGAVFAQGEELPTARQVPFAPLTSGRHKPALATAPYVRFLVAEGSKSAGALDAAATLAVVEVQKVLAESQGRLGWGDVAILCRRSGAFPAYENALEGAGIPYVVVSGQGFYRRPEIRDLLNALRAVADPTDSLALFGLLRSPAIGFADTEIYHWQQAALAAKTSLWAHLGQQSGAAVEQAMSFIRQLNGLVGRVSVSDLLKHFVDESGYLAILARNGQSRSVRNIHKLLDDALQSGLVDVGEYLHYVELVTSSGAREGEARTAEGGAVQLMTVHAAKGLEFPVVILGDANAKLVANRDRILLDDTLGVVLKVTDDNKRLAAIWQIAKQDDEVMDEAEAKRVLYVACTRAEELLIVSGTMSRNRPEPGSWLKQLWEAAETSCDPLPETAADGASPALSRWQVDGHPVSYYQQPAPEETQDAATTATPAGAEASAEAGAGAERPFVAALVEPLPAAAAYSEEEPEIWRITRSREPNRRPPHWVVSRLVQTGLAGWVFDRPALAALLPSLAAGYGLLDRELIDAAVQRTMMLLERLRRHPLWSEIERAEQRWHGLPYSVLNQAGAVESGVIELLCRQGEVWVLFNFCSEPLVADKWRSQVTAQRPRLVLAQTAIAQMTGTRPRVRTVFLDDQRMIRISELESESQRPSFSPAGQWEELLALADEPHRALFAACAQAGLPPAEGYADLVIDDVVAAAAILLWPERRLAVADPADQTNWGVLVRAGYHVEAVAMVTAEQLHKLWKERS